MYNSRTQCAERFRKWLHRNRTTHAYLRRKQQLFTFNKRETISTKESTHDRVFWYKWVATAKTNWIEQKKKNNANWLQFIHTHTIHSSHVKNEPNRNVEFHHSRHNKKRFSKSQKSNNRWHAHVNERLYTFDVWIVWITLNAVSLSFSLRLPLFRFYHFRCVNLNIDK